MYIYCIKGEVLPPADIILRPEHGVVFDAVGIVDNDMSSWFQTFIVPMRLKAFHKITSLDSLKPIPIDKFHTVNLAQNRAIMSGSQAVVQAIMADYDTRIHTILNELATLQADTNALLQPYDVSTEANSIKFDVDAFSSQEYIQAMVNVIRGGINKPPRALVSERFTYTPQNGFTKHHKRHRNRRSWLPFIGKIAKTVFGTATDEDIATINLHIAKFEKLRTEISTGQTEILDKVHSLYKTVDKRVELLKSITDSILHNISDISHDIERQLYILVGLGSLKYETLISFQQHLLTEQEGLNRLFQGYLPREFVTPSMLKNFFLLFMIN
jgi:hypothetical protein